MQCEQLITLYSSNELSLKISNRDGGKSFRRLKPVVGAFLCTCFLQIDNLAAFSSAEFPIRKRQFSIGTSREISSAKRTQQEHEQKDDFTKERLALLSDSDGEEIPDLTQVDVIYGSRSSLVYDSRQERFLPKSLIRKELAEIKLENRTSFLLRPVVTSPPVRACRRFFAYQVKPFVSAALIPEGVTPAYYRYASWRNFQRLINANLQVFGTQSLLMGLGIKTKSLAASSAVLNWVLKDALGKIVRMFWASKMSGKFDSDAKRWRFRASLLYATGNGMEITTYLFPQLFLLFATVANCCKQMSMLTCSSTRTALYNSFRDGTRENIGDITAKGEASIAIVDLLGIATGVSLSRLVGTSPRSVIAIYLILQSLEIFAIYRMMRTVQFRVLNFERLIQVLQDFVEMSVPSDSSAAIAPLKTTSVSACNNITAINGDALKDGRVRVTAIKTPAEMASTEKILRPPAHLSRRVFAFGSLGRAKLDPEELSELFDIFVGEKFLLVVGKNRKRPRRHRWFRQKDSSTTIQENCHIVLHAGATNADIVKSSLALIMLRRKLAALVHPDLDAIRTRDCYDLIRQSRYEADKLLPRLLKQMANQGWTSPARFMFGRVTMRAEWPIRERRLKTNNNGSIKDQ